MRCSVGRVSCSCCQRPSMNRRRRVEYIVWHALQGSCHSRHCPGARPQLAACPAGLCRHYRSSLLGRVLFVMGCITFGNLGSPRRAVIMERPVPRGSPRHTTCRYPASWGIRERRRCSVTAGVRVKGKVVVQRSPPGDAMLLCECGQLRRRACSLRRSMGLLSAAGIWNQFRRDGWASWESR